MRETDLRLAVFGGTFDPIHHGHLRMAEEARDRLGFDRVLFVPNNVSPFKTRHAVTTGTVRAEMLEAAVADNPAFAVSRFEIEREGPSYTVETLRYLSAAHPNTELYFLTGTDAVRDLPKWHQPEEVLRLARFAVMTRPGVNARDVLNALPDPWERRITFIEMPGLDISATDLRARVATGRSIRYLLPPSVEAIISVRGLYRDPAAVAAREL